MKTSDLKLNFVLLLVISSTYCYSQNYEFQEVDITSEQEKLNSLGAFNYNGKAAKSWKKALKHCINSVLLNKENAEYLGASNSISVGDIMQSDFNTALRNFKNLGLTTEEVSNIIKKGAWSTCTRTLKRKMDINVLLNAQFQTGDKSMDAELSSKIGGKKKVEFKVDGWQQNELFINDFVEILREKNKDGYIADMTNPNNFILNREIKVKGFRAKVTTDKTFSIGLKDSLQNGMEAKLNNLSGSLKLVLTGENTVEITTTDEFVVFGKFSTIKN